MTNCSHAAEFAGLATSSNDASSSLQTPSGPLVAIGLLVFAAVWLPQLTLTGLSPPVDNIEQLTWVRSLQWGYYKHPPLPTWLLWLPVQWLGLSEWTACLLGGAVTLAALGIFWHLLRDVRGPTYAAIALLAALCITYYNGRLNYYNHNMVLLLAVTASAWCCWRAFDQKRLRWWLLLGSAVGLGALAKYQVAVTMVSVLCFWVWQRGWREPLHVRGLLLAASIALAIFTPHLLWLQAHDFEPVRYALTTSLGVRLGATARFLNAGHWLADQLLNRGMPAMILLSLCARSVGRGPERQLTGGHLPRPGAKPGSRALVVCWAVVPLLFMPAVGIAFGSDLQLQWGTAFLPFAVPAAMELMPGRAWQDVRMSFALKAFMALQGVLLLVNYATSPVGLQVLKDHHWRTFESKLLAQEVGAPARAMLGGSIRVVVGDAAIAGVLALRLPERPVVLIDGHLRNSPWVPGSLVSRCGALEVIRATLRPVDATPAGTAFPGIYWRSVKPLQASPSCPE